MNHFSNQRCLFVKSGQLQQWSTNAQEGTMEQRRTYILRYMDDKDDKNHTEWVKNNKIFANVMQIERANGFPRE